MVRPKGNIISPVEQGINQAKREVKKNKGSHYKLHLIEIKVIQEVKKEKGRPVSKKSSNNRRRNRCKSKKGPKKMC